MNREKTYSLLVQAAAFVELEAQSFRERETPDHLGRGKAQCLRVADVNDKFAAELRAHAEHVMVDSEAALRAKANQHIVQLCDTVNVLAKFRKVRAEDFKV